MRDGRREGKLSSIFKEQGRVSSPCVRELCLSETPRTYVPWCLYVQWRERGIVVNPIVSQFLDLPGGDEARGFTCSCLYPQLEDNRCFLCSFDDGITALLVRAWVCVASYSFMISFLSFVVGLFDATLVWIQMDVFVVV